MKAKVIFLLIFITICLIACKKDNDNCNLVAISLTNYLDFDLDSVLVGSTFESDPMMFYDLKSGGATDFKESECMDIKIGFIAYFGEHHSRGTWQYPGTPLDPTGPIPIAGGRYKFGIIDNDTAYNWLTVALISQ